jgi:acyl-CoA dehydrogenase
MDFEYSDTCQQLMTQLERFMDDHVYPNESLVGEQVRESGDPHCEPPILKELRAKAKGLGLWNLFLPDKEHGAGLTNLEYAPLCEIMGRSQIASRVFNCNAPDTGNMSAG